MAQFNCRVVIYRTAVWFFFNHDGKRSWKRSMSQKLAIIGGKLKRNIRKKKNLKARVEENERREWRRVMVWFKGWRWQRKTLTGNVVSVGHHQMHCLQHRNPTALTQRRLQQPLLQFALTSSRRFFLVASYPCRVP